MPRYVYHPVSMKLVDADEYYAEKHATIARSHLPTPRILADNIEIRSMHDGEMYTSKGKLREAYRAAGVEEVGNEKLTRKATKDYTPEGVKTDVAQAIAAHS